jgi:outer membrane receptor protein involved in Fe transport
MTKMKIKVFLLFSFLAFSTVLAQENRTQTTKFNTSSILAPRKLVDCPTAALLPRGSFDFDIRVYPGGGSIFAIDIGLMRRLMVGMSFGGQNVIGEGEPDWNPRIEFAVKYRMINESFVFPALAIGYDSQGDGAYNDSLKRYTYKSKGFYAVLSKGYASGDIPIGLHAGANYSLENEDKDKNVTIFFGADVLFGENFGAVAEYDLGSNDDNAKELFGKGYGYLNVGAQWIFSKSLYLQFNLKNLLLNRKNASTWGRELKIVYFESF